MSADPWDVAVVGGGPAGSSAAISLARQGLRVVMYEAKTYPHDKLCGEFLSPECVGLLADLGLSRHLVDLQPVEIKTATLTTPDGTAWETRLPGTALGLSRKMLDAALAEEAQRAGVTVCEASTVSRLSGSLSDGFELDITGSRHTTTISARAVIAAYGKRAALDRVLGRRFLAKHQPYLAIKAHFYGPPIPGRIELHSFPGGYCGISEIEGGAKAFCLLVHEKTFQKTRGKKSQGVDTFVAWLADQNLYLRTWLQWAERIYERWITIAQVSFMRKPVIEGDILMAGDSAGLIAPLAGNGIAMALEGGVMAAGWLSHYLDGEIKLQDLRRGYPAAWNRRFGLRLRLGQALQPLMLNPRMASLALRLMNTFPRAGQYLVEHTRSVDVPAENGIRAPRA